MASEAYAERVTHRRRPAEYVAPVGGLILVGLVIAWLIKGEQLTLLPNTPAGDWVKVRTGHDLTGWINSNYCERQPT